MAEIEYEGLVIDTVTGEIIDGDQSIDNLVYRAHEAQEQRKRWGEIESALKSAIDRAQVEKRAAYGRIVATRVSGTFPKLSPKWRTAVLEGEIPPDAHAELLAGAKAFDKAILGPVMMGFVENYTEHEPKRPYILLSVAEKRAPKARDNDGNE